MKKIAINGFGRIGRASLKVIMDTPGPEVVAVNDLEMTRVVNDDLEMTRVVNDDLVEVMSWYHNEWGFTNQMVRQILTL